MRVLHVYLEVALLGGSVGAQTTLEGLFPRVDANMALQPSFDGEELAAVGALEAMQPRHDFLEGEAGSGGRRTSSGVSEETIASVLRRGISNHQYDSLGCRVRRGSWRNLRENTIQSLAPALCLISPVTKQTLLL